MFRPVWTLALLVFSQLSFAQVILGDVPLEQNPNILSPIKNLNNQSEIIISRKQYVLSYNKNRRNPNWVAWKLEPADMGSVARQKFFSVDAELENYLGSSFPNEQAVSPFDYKGSCFDRGHQVPSADRDVTDEDNIATFLMSNVVPQTAYLNRKPWAHIEQYTRNEVLAGKKAYVIVGSIYDEDFGKIGPAQDISVPSKNFKVVVFLKPNETLKDINATTSVIVVDMPNLTSKGTKPNQDQATLCSDYQVKNDEIEDLVSLTDWKIYQTSLGEVEQLSGFKLLSL